MLVIYIVLLVCMAAFLFGSYHGIVNGAIWGCWLTGISLFIIFAVLLGLVMFKQ